MKRNARIGFVLLLITLCVTATTTRVLAQTQTGTIEGKISDEQGGVLPGVTVTLTGRQGSQTSVTNDLGEYRFLAVNPGDYVVRAELPGFLPRQQEGIDLGLGKTLQVNFSLQIGGITEKVEVTGGTTVDATTAATDTTLSQELLFKMPIYDSTGTDLLNSAPGVNNSSAFGGQAAYGNALLLDGVDTRDPEGGSAWTFFNYNLVEEVHRLGR